MTDFIEVKNNLELIAVQAEAVRAIGASRGQMHKALVVTLLHIAKHGDWNGAARFFDLIKKDEHSRTIAKPVQKWLETYGGLIVSIDRTQPDTLGKIVGWKGLPYLQANIESCKSNPYYGKLSVPTVFAGFSLDEALGKVLNEAGRINKKMEEGKYNDIEKAKVKMQVSQATLNALLAACGLEVVLNDDAKEVLAS